MKIFACYLAVVFPACIWGFSVLSRDQTCPPVKLDAKTNVWENYSLHINPFYRQPVLDAAELIKDEDLRRKALKIADVGTFFWLSVAPLLFGSIPFSPFLKTQLTVIGTTSPPYPSLKKSSNLSHATAS